MVGSEVWVLAAVGYLLFKHMIADFLLQTHYQISHKMDYGHPGGLIHAGIHATLTLPVYFILPAASSVIATIAAIEFVVHYHIDYLKERVISERNWSTVDAPYWWALGTDQLLHNATYLGMVMVLVRLG